LFDRPVVQRDDVVAAPGRPEREASVIRRKTDRVDDGGVTVQVPASICRR
jgi:hypothetical protein